MRPCGWRSRRPRRVRCASARRACGRSTRRLPLQPPSTAPFEGSPRIAKSAAKRSGPRARKPRQAVEVGVDLFVVVPHPGDVDPRVAQFRGELELHGDAGLHVDGSAPPHERLAVDLDVARRHVVVDRNRVDVTGDHHPLGAAEQRARHDRVAVADRSPGAAERRMASSMRSASTFSSPETLGMSQIVLVRSMEVAVRSSGGILRV